MGRFVDTLKLLKSLTSDESSALDTLSRFLDSKEIKKIRSLVKQGKISFKPYTLSLAESSYSLLRSDYKEQKSYVESMNSRLKKQINKKAFHDFSKHAPEKIKSVIAPHIVGFDSVKRAVLLQLFALDKLHVLMLGDPGTGKTEILRSASDIYPISSFGLGSGTSSAGLSVTVKGKDIMPGLLPMADGGLACIDELNLMKKDEMASLYNAMEKGFVTYDKGGDHLKFNARISVLATANPKKDKFSGKNLSELKKQLPFDSALLSRFHLIFFVLRPDVDEFRRIARSIIKDERKEINQGDIEFIRDYIKHSESIDVVIPSSMEHQIVDFVADLKKNEDTFMVEVSPRMVTGFVRMAKAAARMELRGMVEQKDVNIVKNIVRESLEAI
ncbi:MAG: ATP-binding protein [Nanoarchaeota archaeon]|nr:ATP-binding protein [Nanoarchaeota archaeon]